MGSLVDLLARKRLLVFDLDGTLVDSSPLHARAFEEACAPFGIAVDYANVAGLTTESAIDRLSHTAGVSLTPEERKGLVDRKRALALSLIESELQPLPGAPEFVSATGGRWQRTLCTSASRAGAEASLRRTGMEGCFDWIVTAGDVIRGKPDPEIFLAALDRAAVPPADALVFEDAPSGLAAARAAGIKAIEIVAGDPQPNSGQANWAMLNAALRMIGLTGASA